MEWPSFILLVRTKTSSFLSSRPLIRIKAHILLPLANLVFYGCTKFVSHDVEKENEGKYSIYSLIASNGLACFCNCLEGHLSTQMLVTKHRDCPIPRTSWYSWREWYNSKRLNIGYLHALGAKTISLGSKLGLFNYKKYISRMKAQNFKFQFSSPVVGQIHNPVVGQIHSFTLTEGYVRPSDRETSKFQISNFNPRGGIDPCPVVGLI